MIDVKVGDIVVRNLAGIPMELIVSAVTDKLIICGGDEKDHIGWWFDRATGAEIDEELGWGPEFGRTGSFLQSVKKAEQ
jgi:hypothetical protein